MEKTPTSPPGSRREAGFTLIELVVVLAIIGLSVGLIAPLVGAGGGGLKQKRAALELASTLRLARSEASLTAREILVVFEPDLRRYAISGLPEGGEIPAEAEVTLETAAQENGEDGSRAIRFYPGGGSTGGRVELAFAAATYKVEVDWLTGRVLVDDGDGD